MSKDETVVALILGLVAIAIVLLAVVLLAR
jgi:hypothetical protein